MHLHCFQLQWMWKCKYLYEVPISFSLGLYPEAGLLGLMNLYLYFLGGTFRLLPLWLQQFTLPLTSYNGLFYCTLGNSSYLWIVAMLTSARWYLPLALVNFSWQLAILASLLFLYFYHFYVIFGESPFKSFAYFKSFLFYCVVWLLSCMSSRYACMYIGIHILIDNYPLLAIYLANIFFWCRG